VPKKFNFNCAKFGKNVAFAGKTYNENRDLRFNFEGVISKLQHKRFAFRLVVKSVKK
jgi:hypothetical protein